MKNSAVKTKKAPIGWDVNNMIVCKYYGDKDDFGKAIWYDENGKAYELIYARLANRYSFNRNSYYDK